MGVDNKPGNDNLLSQQLRESARKHAIKGDQALSSGDSELAHTEYHSAWAETEQAIKSSEPSNLSVNDKELLKNLRAEAFTKDADGNYPELPSQKMAKLLNLTRRGSKEKKKKKLII